MLEITFVYMNLLLNPKTWPVSTLAYDGKIFVNN